MDKQPTKTSNTLLFTYQSKLFLLLFFVLYALLFFAREINLLTADIGRHIVNGKVFFETLHPISTNFYSYTEPNITCINHHWGSGVLFYLIHQYFGFEGLSICYILLLVGAMVFFVLAAYQYADYRLVFISALTTIPIIAYRTEVRPEGFSYFFLGLSFYILTRFREGKIRPYFTLLSLCFIQVLWVNTHIYFFIGILLPGLFLLDDVLSNPPESKFRLYMLTIALLVVSSLLNPFTLQGLLTPLTIFNEYGYMISENQSISFMEAKFAHPVYTHFKLLTCLLLIIFIVLHFRKMQQRLYFLIFPLLLFAVMSFFAVRALPLFGLITIIAVAVAIQQFFEHYTKSAFWLNGAVAITIAIVCFSTLSGYSTQEANKQPNAVYTEPTYFSPLKYTTGIGLFPNINASADFFLKNNLKGPIFNDYDIGGYLIYNLYGREKVFVDNRPEAYSSAFFKTIYIPMQENMELFRQMEKRYNFNCVWFYMHEDSPWANSFLLHLIQQPDYAAVFSDGLTVIFLKRNESNAALIQQFEIPKSKFSRRS